MPHPGRVADRRAREAAQAGVDVNLQFQVLGGGLGPERHHGGAGETGGVERTCGQLQPAIGCGLGVQRSVQHLEQFLGLAEGGGELVAARGAASARPGGGGQHVGHAGQAIADLVRQGGQDAGLGLGQALGDVQRARPLGDQRLALGGQGELPAQNAVEDQAQRQRQGQGAAGGHRFGPVGGTQQERDQGRGRGERRDGQKRDQARGGEEEAGHGRGHVHGQHQVVHPAGMEAEYGDLRHGQGPEQAAADVQRRARRPAQGACGATPQPVHHRIEGSPVQAELDEDGRHPHRVVGVGARPDEDRQGHGEEADGVGQEVGLGVQGPPVHRIAGLWPSLGQGRFNAGGGHAGSRRRARLRLRSDAVTAQNRALWLWGG